MNLKTLKSIGRIALTAAASFMIAAGITTVMNSIFGEILNVPVMGSGFAVWSVILQIRAKKRVKKNDKPIKFLTNTPRAIDIVLKTISCYMLYVGIITVAEMIFRENFYALISAAAFAVLSGVYLIFRK